MSDLLLGLLWAVIQGNSSSLCVIIKVSTDVWDKMSEENFPTCCEWAVTIKYCCVCVLLLFMYVLFIIIIVIFNQTSKH